MLNITENINALNLTSNVIKILQDNNINTINDLWLLTRKDLKKLGLTDKEIKQIVISLQLNGIDLNKKIYD